MVDTFVRISLTMTLFTLSASELVDMENLNWCFIKSPLEQNIIKNFLGDGHCDDAINIPECDYDLGDCCLNTFNRDGFGQYVWDSFLGFDHDQFLTKLVILAQIWPNLTPSA